MSGRRRPYLTSRGPGPGPAAPRPPSAGSHDPPHVRPIPGRRAMSEWLSRSALGRDSSPALSRRTGLTGRTGPASWRWSGPPQGKGVADNHHEDLPPQGRRPRPGRRLPTSGQDKTSTMLGCRGSVLAEDLFFPCWPATGGVDPPGSGSACRLRPGNVVVFRPVEHQTEIPGFRRSCFDCQSGKSVSVQPLSVQTGTPPPGGVPRYSGGASRAPRARLNRAESRRSSSVSNVM
jgi:hypothetical protein